MAGAQRFTPARVDDFKGPRWCDKLASASPMLAACLNAGPKPLPAGWRRDGGGGQGGVSAGGNGVFADLPNEPGAPSRLVLPPPDHPFWRSADVAAQTVAMFNEVMDERDAISVELATTLVRREANAHASRLRRVEGVTRFARRCGAGEQGVDEQRDRVAAEQQPQAERARGAGAGASQAPFFARTPPRRKPHNERLRLVLSRRPR